MKIQLFPFSRDLRSDMQRQQYQAIEQKRADAWLDIGTRRMQILKRQMNSELPGLMRKQAN